MYVLTRVPPMITLHAFANMFPSRSGETKDMRVQWALEEMDLSYEVRSLDYLGGAADSPEFAAISPVSASRLAKKPRADRGAAGRRFVPNPLTGRPIYDL